MHENIVKVQSGWFMLAVVLASWITIPASFLMAAIAGDNRNGFICGFFIVCGVIMIPLAIILTKGLFTLQPREARVLVLFGKYVGTVKEDGFHWANPFSVVRGPFIAVQQAGSDITQFTKSEPRYKVSLRTRNFETQRLKVNDQRGNPIEIAAVVVWRVDNTALALFEVDDFKHYVHIQSESAVRHLANIYPYDHVADSDDNDTEVTLRDSSETINVALRNELHERLQKAGVIVEEARLTHLAYAPEIASAMLRRQQADAVISARKKIVHGAVSMVEMALNELEEKEVLSMTEDRKASMVGNLLVVLCSETQAEPVINTSS